MDKTELLAGCIVDAAEKNFSDFKEKAEEITKSYLNPAIKEKIAEFKTSMFDKYTPEQE